MSVFFAEFRQGWVVDLTWPKKDRIQWAEQRLLEWESLAAGRRAPDPKFERRLPARKDLEVWLAKEREELSWQQVVIKYFPEYLNRGKGKTAGVSTARRAHQRIEEARAPSRKQYLRSWLDGSIEELFRCTPDEFRSYILSTPDKRKK